MHFCCFRFLFIFFWEGPFKEKQTHTHMLFVGNPPQLSELSKDRVSETPKVHDPAGGEDTKH